MPRSLKLHALLKPLDPKSRASLTALLENMEAAGLRTTADLHALLLDEHAPASHRVACAWFISRLRAPRALTTLLEALKASDPVVRASAALELGTLGSTSAVQVLIAAAEQDASGAVRTQALLSLSCLATPDLVHRILQIARRSTEPAVVRGAAIEALSSMAALETVPELALLLNDPEPEVRYWTIFTLGQLQDRSVLPRLRDLQDSETASFHGTLLADEARLAIENLEFDPGD